MNSVLLFHFINNLLFTKSSNFNECTFSYKVTCENSMMFYFFFGKIEITDLEGGMILIIDIRVVIIRFETIDPLTGLHQTSSWIKHIDTGSDY